MAISSWADLFHGPSPSNGHTTNGFDVHRFERQSEELLANAIMARQEFLRQFLDPRRDIESECGHVPLGTPVDPWRYYDLFNRDAIAGRVVEIWPKESWQVLPGVFEVEDEEETDFELALRKLCRTLRGEHSYYYDDEMTLAPMWEELVNLDIVAGINQYGALFLGLEDPPGTDLTSPVEYREGRRLLYMRSFPEVLAPVTKWDNDPMSPRYGFPEEYELHLCDPRQSSSGVAPPSTTLKVHWSRVIHYADNPLFNKVLGIPRLQQVLDRVQDLRKLYGGSAEMYWKAAFYGLAVESNPNLGGNVRFNVDAAKNSVENYWNSLDRILYLSGASAKVLTPTVVDPGPQIDKHIEAVCIKGGYPKRIFMGSERGELASTQDDSAWNDRLRQRELFTITPKQIIPLMDRLIEVGCLPKPVAQRDGTTLNVRKRVVRYKKKSRGKGKAAGQVAGKALRPETLSTYEDREADVYDIETEVGYVIRWPDLTSQSADEKATVLAKRTQAWSQYASSGMDTVVPPQVYATEFDSMPVERAEAMLTEAAEAIEEQTATEPEVPEETPVETPALPASPGTPAIDEEAFLRP